MGDNTRHYFGSLADGGASDKQNKSADNAAAAVLAGKRAGNINVGDSTNAEVLELSETSRQAQEQHAELLKRYEAQARARSLLVPTAISDVIQKLRELGHPATLFGEKAADRRERLRELLARREVEGDEEARIAGILGAPPGIPTPAPPQAQQAAQQQQQQPTNQLFYTPGTEQIKKARKYIAKYSFSRAEERINRAKDFWASETQREERDRVAKELYENSKGLVIVASQMGDERPLSKSRVSPDGSSVAIGSWTGLVKLFDFESSEEQIVFKGHPDRITGLAWNPAFREANGTGPVLVSGSADQTAKLWSRGSSTPLRTFTGHSNRLGNVAFHPSGRFVGTASFDTTWRLWDVETGAELLLQEGHGYEVYSIAFHPDGSLAATGDLKGACRLWDLRSGKNVIDFLGHVDKVLGMDFSPNGYQLVTGSNDHAMRVWDLRKRVCSYVVPAHSNLISDVRFSPRTGEMLLSCSYDGSAKLWSTRDWSPLKLLAIHQEKIMSGDFHPDEKRVVTSCHDRTFKRWAHLSEF